MLETNKIIQGNCLDVIKTFPDKCIDCVITSPPYWQLRDYAWDGQWGLEPTFQMYLENLWNLMDEVYRVIKDTGTVWINLGDTYTANRGYQVTQSMNEEYKIDTERFGFRPMKVPDGLKAKCLLLLPHRFAIGCIDRGWIMRNDIIWAKRNGMPESVTDRFSKKHEYFFLMVKSEKYYFDLDGVRDRHAKETIKRYEYGWNGNEDRDFKDGPQNHNSKFMSDPDAKRAAIENGKNPGSVSDFWNITTKGSKDNHYASYNTQLIDKPIVAGCPQYVCNSCGKPRLKIFETKETKENTYQVDATGKSGGTKKTFNGGNNRDVLGLTDCGCNAGFSGGIILDPFCGTATTGCRAIDLQRKFIGIEGKEEYVKIGNKKLLPFQITQQLF